ncbi:MAG: choice-of-anchor J domain-containing protein, partial [Candidatus Cloacimonetes bacterium]|nr:choice-of-anchor J domain-containing protein [Candidatus Cloacimonadota bacterium]MDY0229912.1 choice-of-anchor J domain-containing protein [Candidatus Cloacimonadaceae bacterium]
MKKLLMIATLLVMMLAMFNIAFADTVQVGTGTATSSYMPLYGLYGYNYTQQIYTQAQINKAGNITKIRFYYVSGTITNSKDWVIYMGHSTKTTFATTTDWEPLANLTEVFNGDVSSMVPLANNWMEITLTTPFNYNNTDNLIVAVDENTPSYASMSWGAFTSGTNTGMYYYSDGTNPNPASPPTASSRVALINRIQFAFPNTTAPLAPTLMAPANGGWSFTDGVLSWSSTLGGADAADYDVYFGSSATPPLVSSAQTSTSYTPTLAAGTTYYWKVVANNEIGTSPASATWSFKTPSATQLAESFEDTTFPPAGWANGTTGNWFRGTSYKVHGLAGAYKSGSTTTQYTLSTPRVTITNGSTLDFWAAGSSITAANLEVVYSPDRVTWTQIGSTITYASTYTFDHHVIDLSSLAGNNYYLGFRTGTAGSGSSYIDMVFGPEITPEAPGPVTLTAPADLATGVSNYPTFTWTAPTSGGIPTAYKVYCGAANPPTTLLGTATTLSYTPTAALPYNTTLYWMVVATNGTGDATGSPVRSFTTMADPTISSFPFVEGFETGNTNASTAINQWMQVTGPEYTAKYWTANNNQTTYNRTPRNGTWNAFLGYSGQSCLIRPIQLTAGTNYFIELYARQNTTDPTDANIQVKYGTQATLAVLTETIIPQTNVSDGEYQRFYGVFTPTSTGVYYIGIQGWMSNATASWYVSLDDITIDVAPAVIAPSALTNTNIDGDSADLGWTENNTPAAAAWKIKYGPVGFDVDTQGTLINTVASNPYPLTGLSSSTSYDWYVLSVTGAGSSTWAGPATFRTAQIPATLPLTEGWESGQGSWAFENGTETNAWYVGTVDPFAGTASAYVSNDNGVSNAYTITTTSVAHIYRDISFGADNLNFPLTFEWKNAGESSFDRLRVYLVDTSVTPVAGTELTTGQVGLTNYSVQPTWTTGSITLPGTLSGSVKRLVFSWRNDGSLGTQPPINLDNISLTAVPVPSGPVLAPNLDYPLHRQENLAKTGFPFQFSWNMAGTEPDVYNLYIANMADLNEGYDSDEFFGAATFFEDVTSPYTPVMSYAYGATYVWTVAGFNAAYPDEVYLWPPNEFTIEPDPAIVSFPHTQNFDAVTVPALPTGWSMINVNGDTVNWASYATNPYSAPNCASIGYNYDLALNDWMVSPALSLQAGTTYALDFKYRGGSTSYVEKLKVMLGSGNQVANLTTQVFINENINFADYTSANATFTVPSTGNYYLGWHAYSIANQLRIYVDDITIRIPAPLPPLAATVSFPQSGSTTLLNPMLKWTPSTAGEPATSFKVYLNQGGAFTESHVVYTGAATQFQTTGLVNGLSYSWKVVPSNANGSTVTCPTWTFNTPGLTQLAEGFEAATFPPMGWA